MNRTGRIEEPEIEAAIDKHCQPNHRDIGRIAVETPPTYFTPTDRRVEFEQLSFDDQSET